MQRGGKEEPPSGKKQQYPVFARLRADLALMMMSRDHFSGNKFITPVVVNGKVYVGHAE